MAIPRLPPSLKLFWGAVIGIVLLGAAILQILGPIQPKIVFVPRKAGAGIPAPSPVLSAASSADPQWKIPHPGPYGVTPMRYYAARATAPAGMPQVAILVGGVGYALVPSNAAVHDLPAAISLALSPYAPHIDAIAKAARAAGHETLMGLPMQVDGEPDTTAGDQALRASAVTAHNLKRLDWALSRESGYAGVTDAIGLSVPEQFLIHPHAGAWLAAQLARDGLFMVVASPGVASPAGMNDRTADVTIDPAQGGTAEAASLDHLTTIAQAKGSALGILSSPTERSIAILADWCKQLASQHIALVPVSALVTTP